MVICISSLLATSTVFVFWYSDTYLLRGSSGVSIFKLDKH
jgi:hypothetical protein